MPQSDHNVRGSTDHPRVVSQPRWREYEAGAADDLHAGGEGQADGETEREPGEVRREEGEGEGGREKEEGEGEGGREREEGRGREGEGEREGRGGGGKVGGGG